MQQVQPHTVVVDYATVAIEIPPNWQLIIPIAVGVMGVLGVLIVAFLMRKRPLKRPESQ